MIPLCLCTNLCLTVLEADGAVFHLFLCSFEEAVKNKSQNEELEDFTVVPRVCQPVILKRTGLSVCILYYMYI